MQMRPFSRGRGARLFMPQLDRLYVAARAGLASSAAAILVFQPSDEGRRATLSRSAPGGWIRRRRCLCNLGLCLEA
jgi:hypothetical protein